MPTIKEVAELAGVSQATVSRVINSNPKVAPANQKKVHAAMTSLGYQPNSFAQALASNRSYSIGMVVGTLSGPFYGPLMHSAEEGLRAQGQHLIVTSGGDRLEQERDAIRFLLSRRVDALILHLSAMGDEEILELSRAKTPLVLVNRYIPEISSQCVYFDNEYGGYLATKHLLELGHRQIATITGPLAKHDSRERLAGYRRALHEFGLDLNPNLLVEGYFEEDGGRLAMQKLLDRKQRFTALFCGNDHIALGAYDLAAENGLVIGNSLSLVGFDDMVFSNYLRPKLSSIHVPVADMGSAAAAKALQMVSGTMPQFETQIRPRLVQRDSSAKLSL
ncbi:LacI family DNA-binding transcriptional regulator [Alginatibacterium sediminis]|uniref:LacI family DNA-binding transcriptional regulator n=1 Tax=Alginatibacterium sediminis TaxID=2164068 RepID=A0A420E6K4_9ALTE|nr:LacI family DNA-binding transcriptional regulator [Alginatibacterium sediminis]RKF13261.1 LacI family DNA-binding transcriptional regulator [Alginatibacterium sediminis]